MKLRIITAAAGILAAALTVTLLPAAAGAASFGPHRAFTTITDHPDSGNGGTWATDGPFRRTLTLTLTGTTGSGASEVWNYEARVSDWGEFRTIAGALTPNQGGAYAGDVITASVIGWMAGTAEYSFTASAPASKAPNMGVPRAESGAPSADPETTSDWYEQAFPAGTTFGGPGIGAWSWHYTVYAWPWNVQTWTDSSTNGDGNLPGDGNITG